MAIETRRRLSRRRLLATSLAVSAASAVAPFSRTSLAAQTPTLGDGGAFDAFIEELDALVREQMTLLNVPGVAVGVIAGGKEYTAGFGVTNIEHPLPVDADTLFQAGSIGKTYTGTLMMRLVDDGLVDLDATVRTYMPDFRVEDETVSEQATVLHLLTHTGGWLGDDFTDTGTGDDAIARYVELLADNPQIAPLGEFFSYNNAAFIAAGRLIEVVTEQTYLEALTEYLLEPLGLERTFLYPEQIMTEVFVSGHTTPPDDVTGDLTVAKPWALPRMAGPAGAHIASINDLMRYARFHLGDGTAEDGTQVLTPESMERMRTPQGPGAPLGPVIVDAVGIAWLLHDLDGTRVVQHGGSTNGQQSTLVLVPERQFAIGVLTNAEAGAILGIEVTDWALGHYLGLHWPVATPIAVDVAELAEYTGRYEDASGEATIVISEQEGVLEAALEIPEAGTIEADGPVAFVGEDLVRVPLMGIPFLADFVRTETGEIGWFRFSGRMYPRV